MAPTQVTLVTGLSRESLLALRDEIDALLGIATSPAAADAVDIVAAPDATVEEMARRLRARINNDLSKVVIYIVDHYPEGTFTWEDVSAGMHEKLGTVKSWHRSLSKPMNRLARDFPAVPPLLTSKWDGLRNLYRINPLWVKAIKKAW